MMMMKTTVLRPPPGRGHYPNITINIHHDTKMPQRSPTNKPKKLCSYFGGFFGGLLMDVRTRLTAIFARDLPLYYSYRRFYVALAQKLFWFSSCHHGDGAAAASTMVCGAATPQVSTSLSPPHIW